MNAYALADFADGDGIFLGYETTQQGNDVVITNKVDLSDYGITDQILKIRDPAKGSLTLKKEDAQTQTSQGNPGHTQAAGTAEAADAASADAVIPQTGDASRPLAWVVLLALSGIALAGLTVCRKRKSR